MADQVSELAADYVRQFGERAGVRVADDISRATARTDWDAVMLLAKVRDLLTHYS